MQASEREGLVRYVALQPHYNLLERGYEHGLADVCRRHDLGCLPYFALAKGFLTGKYRPGADEVRSERAKGAGAYLDERGERVLAALDAAAAAHDVPVAAVEPRLAGRAADRRLADRQRPHAASSWPS